MSAGASSTRKAATREQLIGATEALISEGGLAAVTTQSVARRGGFAEGTIYRHFESRDELIVATLRERFRDDFDEAVTRLSERVGKASVETNLREFMTSVIPLHATIAPAVGMLAADPALAAKNADALREDCKGPRITAERVAGYFRAEQELGRVSPAIDPAVAAGMLVSVGFYRALMLHLMGEDPIGLPAAQLAAAVALILSPPRAARTHTPPTGPRSRSGAAKTTATKTRR